MKHLCFDIKINYTALSVFIAAAGLFYKFRQDKPQITIRVNPIEQGKKRSFVIENVGGSEVKNVVIESVNKNIQIGHFDGLRPYEDIKVLPAKSEKEVLYLVCSDKEKIIRVKYQFGWRKKTDTFTLS